MIAEFHVEGMSCQHCVAAVTEAIHDRDAIAQVKIDLAGHRVIVDSQQPAEVLEAAIVDAGYTVIGNASTTTDD
jgi:copper chaperone